MLRAMVSSPRRLIFGLTVGFLSAFGLQAQGQTGPSVTVGNLQLRGVPDDWSHHHVMFSNPGTEQEAIQSGHYAEWQKAVKEPRYVLQQMKRNLPVQGPSAVDAEYRSRWISETSGGPGDLGRAREDFKPRADFERHPKGPFRGGGPFPQSFPGGVKNDWNQSVGTGLSSTAINFPAKWSFATGSESCTTDFVVFATGQTGSATQATIMADYNLYSSCGGTDPTVNWQYNTGTGSTVSLAPEFSYDGSQVAFIQSNGTAASLVLLRYKLITSGSGALSTLTSQSTAANYYNSGAGCTAPCMYAIPLSGGPNDTWSNPYYDYSSDTLYVGDSAGKLHKFTPVFHGAPAEVTTTWPIQMKRGATTDPNQLASPVYDSTSGNVFVGSTTSVSTTTGGYFYAVNASSGAIQGYSSIQLDTFYGVRDGPLIDPVAETAYVFSGYNAGGNSAVYQFSASGFSGSTAATATASLGTGANSDLAYMFSGAFDNTYFTSSSGTTPTGNLYVCGTGHIAPGGDTLEQVAITSGVMSTTPTIGPNVDTTLTYYPRCSPLTEFYNSNATVTAATATGTITVSGTVATGWAGVTVTVGSVPYALETTITGPNQVLLHTSGTGFAGRAINREDTAQNFRAVLDASPGECADTGCVDAVQTANAAVTHPAGYTTGSTSVTLTAATTGAAGDFTLTSSNTGDISVSGGNNGVDGTTGKDYLFVSVFASTETGCTNNVADGCVMSFDITTPSNFKSTSTPLGTLNISSPALNTLTTGNPAAPTSGIVIDNNGTAAGESQIYFLTQLPTATTACVTGGADGICAIQAAQSAP